jgi:hypothetical protein
VIRTFFPGAACWHSLCKTIETEFELQDEVHFISDPRLEGKSAEELLDRMPLRSCHSSVFIVDESTFKGCESTVLVMDLWEEPGRTFRVVPSEMPSVHANLWLANMDFVDYADSVDADGVFRGFVA